MARLVGYIYIYISILQAQLLRELRSTTLRLHLKDRSKLCGRRWWSGRNRGALIRFLLATSSIRAHRSSITSATRFLAIRGCTISQLLANRIFLADIYAFFALFSISSIPNGYLYQKSQHRHFCFDQIARLATFLLYIPADAFLYLSSSFPHPESIELQSSISSNARLGISSPPLLFGLCNFVVFFSLIHSYMYTTRWKISFN